MAPRNVEIPLAVDAALYRRKQNSQVYRSENLSSHLLTDGHGVTT